MKTIFVTLALILSPSLAGAEIHIATLESPKGSTLILRSDDEDLEKNSPSLKDLKVSSHSKLCQKSRAHHLEQHLELDYIITNLLGSNKLGTIHKREVAKTPNCEPFRYKLHVLSKINEGYTLKKFVTLVEPNPLHQQEYQQQLAQKRAKSSLWNEGVKAPKIKKETPSSEEEGSDSTSFWN